MKPKSGCATHTEKSKTPFPSNVIRSNSKLNIHDIIDDAMNKKDRIITIYFGDEGTTVSIYPLEYDSKIQED